MRLVIQRVAKPLFGCALLLACSGCDNVVGSSEFDGYLEFEQALIETFSRKPSQYSPAVRLMKRGSVDSWLATIHGYPDNRSVCEELIEPYNSDPELSVLPGTYYCEAIT